MGAFHRGDQRCLVIEVWELVMEEIREAQILMYRCLLQSRLEMFMYRCIGACHRGYQRFLDGSLSQSRLELFRYRCMGACHRLDQRCLDIDVQELVIEKIRDVQLQMYGSLSQRLYLYSYIWQLVKELDLNRNPYNLNIIGYSVYIYFFIKYVKLQMN